jgi:hypothetical protein
LARSFEPYSKITNNIETPSLTEFEFQIRQWRALRGRVEMIMNSTTSNSLIQACGRAVSQIEAQIALSSNRSEDARFPRDDEFEPLLAEWARSVSSPLYRIIGVGKPYHRDLIGDAATVAADAIQLNASPELTSRGLSFNLERRSGFIPQAPLPGTVPLYQLISASGQTSMFATDDTETVFAQVNDGWRVPATGRVAGHVFTEPKHGAVPLWRTTCSLGVSSTKGFCETTYPELKSNCKQDPANFQIVDVMHSVGDAAPAVPSWPTAYLPRGMSSGRMTCESTQLGYVLTNNSTPGTRCPIGKTLCGSTCVDTSADAANCGGCGLTCSSGAFCSQGVCGRRADGEPCGTPSECASSVCSQFYPDADGDGYGRSNEVIRVCGTAAPLGYVAAGNDCCDVSDAASRSRSAQIKPGQTAYFEWPAGICGIDWDWNCSGSVETQSNAVIACNTPSGWIGSAPSCGRDGAWTTDAYCNVYGLKYYNSTKRFQACR